MTKQELEVEFSAVTTKVRESLGFVRMYSEYLTDTQMKKAHKLGDDLLKSVEPLRLQLALIDKREMRAQEALNKEVAVTMYEAMVKKLGGK